MNELTLKEFNDNKVVYLYRPEGDGTGGEVVYLFADKSAKVTVKAENDSALGRYGHNAARKVEEVVGRDNLLPRKFMQAWN